jgi:CheY-like chemotaxis protein
VSAHVTEADGDKARQAGFDACLAKPVDRQDVEDD